MKPETNFKIAIIYIVLVSVFISEVKVTSKGASVDRPIVGLIYILLSIIFLLILQVQYYKSKSK